MIKEFIDYTSQIFSAIDTSQEGAIHNTLKQYNQTNLNWFSSYPKLEFLSQGDIVEKIPFVTFDEETGKKEVITQMGLVLSTTCDISRDKYIVVAPLLPISADFNTDQISTLKKNEYSGRMCFANTAVNNYYVDFSRSSAVNNKLLKKTIESNKTRVLYSLSQIGLWVLYTKLTIYYIRPETTEYFGKRSEGISD